MQRTSAGVAARLDRLPPTRYVRNLILRISLGGWFELYDLFMTGYIALGLIGEGHFRATTARFFDLNGFASFIAAGFAGMFVGTLVFSWISDRFGRRATFTYSLLFYSCANAIMAFAHGAAAIDAWRFVAGLGIGVQLVTIDTYISELAPRTWRGRAIALSQFVGYLAIPIVALFALLLVPHVFAGLAGWRYVVLIGSLGVLAIWPLRARLPESPRWLEIRGRAGDADAATSAIENAVAAETGKPLPPIGKHRVETGAGSWSDLWRPPYRERTIVLIVFNFAQTIMFYGFASWVPVLLGHEGVTLFKTLLYTLLIAIVNPVGPLVAMWCADRWQRKWQIVWLALATAVFGLLFAYVRVPALIVLFGGLITLANAWFSCAFHAYQAELFPTAIRARAVGFVYSWSRFSAIFVGFVIASLLGRYGTPGVFAFIAAAAVVVAIAIGGFGVATNRRALEELSPS
ncbi:MAG TPA: MFS transporter [Candidatus Baltobacteraceae bacterium]